MHYFLIALLVAAFWHYIAQRILVPDQRFMIRCELFEIRDHIRMRMIRGSSQKEMAELNILHERCNSLINRVHLITAESFVRFYFAVQSSPDLQQKIESRATQLDHCSEEVKVIHQDLSKAALKAISANSLGLMPYVAPVLALPAVTRSIKQFSQQINIVRKREFDRFIPPTSSADPITGRLAI